MVVDTLTEANISRVYPQVLTTPLAEIRCLGIWHLVASFHRCIHMNRSSESIAESAGSILSFIDAKWRSGPSMPVSYVVSSAMVRMAGIRGLGGEDGVLATALNMHFASSGPEGWHFQTRRPLAPSRACQKAEIVREVRQALLPPWIQFTVRDLALTRRMRFARKLPYPRAVTGQVIDSACASDTRKTPSLAIGSSDDGAGAPAATSKLRAMPCTEWSMRPHHVVYLMRLGEHWVCLRCRYCRTCGQAHMGGNFALQWQLAIGSNRGISAAQLQLVGQW